MNEKIADVFTGRSMKEFARKIARLAYDDKIHQESLIDAPDEFLDPILNSIMLEPVILPSSKITIDRSTIARHLLSDQTDPFNRSPLTMDQLKTDVNLKLRIEQWIHDKKEAYKLLNKSNHIENRFVDDVNDDSTQVVSELREAKNVDVDDSDEKNFK